MATNATRSRQAAPDHAAAQAALAPEKDARRTEPLSAPGAPEDSARKPAGYGLPCSKCRLYYSADLDACPTCHHTERVAPVAPQLPPRVAKSAPQPAPDTSAVEKEREEFLRQFKSQLLEARAEVASAPESLCSGENHTGDLARAEICKACYERLQERLDVCEGAFHFDLKEAAQIIYDAVWADPSDPNKTYQNAASALLTELRKRAGINAVVGPFQPLSH